MPRVLIGAPTLYNDRGPYYEVLLAAGFEVIFPPTRQAETKTEDEIIALLPGIDAVLAGSEPYTRRVLDTFPQLKIIARIGVGYDAVDLAAATERGVPVTVAPANREAVAEHTFALMLALAKQVIPQHLGLVRGEWLRRANQPLRGRTLGIVGLGRVGKAVAVRAAVFGMRVIANEPYPDHAFIQQHAIELVPLGRLCAESDYVSLHLPLTAESRYLIDRTYLNLMKPSAYLINTARGPVVKQDHLFEALRERHIAGAGLDVFEKEPPGDHPICQLDNVVLTPHTAGVDARAGADMALMAAQTVVALSRGEWPEEAIVNPAVREKFQWRQ